MPWQGSGVLNVIEVAVCYARPLLRISGGYLSAGWRGVRGIFRVGSRLAQHRLKETLMQKLKKP